MQLHRLVLLCFNILTFKETERIDLKSVKYYLYCTTGHSNPYMGIINRILHGGYSVILWSLGPAHSRSGESLLN